MINLEQNLKDLHLPTMRECYRSEADVARQESLTYERYLSELVSRECELRKHKRISRFLRESKLPLEKNLEIFDRKRLPSKINALVDHLLEGSFLDRSENVLAFGNPGSGKTHILCAIALELIQQDRRVIFAQCNLLVQNLLAAKRDLTLIKVLKKMAKYDALIIDDIGYVQQSREEMEVLFTLLAYCYERTSIMLTSNLPFSKWEQIFKDPMTTAAAIDRLVHHSIILELNLPSYRLERSKNNCGKLCQ
ncbi:MAG: IS21-like element helper ATPase IstB [Pseudomonadota bacterium]|nr:IS21-like element helper ATPase IstB [Pseudomonadota bacterium]